MINKIEEDMSVSIESSHFFNDVAALARGETVYDPKNRKIIPNKYIIIDWNYSLLYICLKNLMYQTLIH